MKTYEVVKNIALGTKTKGIVRKGGTFNENEFGNKDRLKVHLKRGNIKLVGKEEESPDEKENENNTPDENNTEGDDTNNNENKPDENNSEGSQKDDPKPCKTCGVALKDKRSSECESCKAKN